MALTNFSLPFGTLTAPWSPAASPLHPVHQQLAASTNNLLYSPAEHQQQADGLPPALGSNLYKNNPYAAPQQQSNPTNQFHVNLNNRRKNTYLPPIPPPGAVNTKYQQQQQQNFFQHQQFSHTNLQEHSNTNNDNRHNLSYQAPASSSSSSHSLSSFAGSRNTHHYADGSYVRQPGIHSDQQQYFSNYPGTATSYQPQHNHAVQTPASTYGAVTTAAATSTATSSLNHNHKAEHATSAQKMNDKDENENNHFPERPSGFTRVQAGQGSRTQVHAVLDYDLEEGEEEDYYDALDQVDPATGRGGGNNKSPVLPVTVTPIQGPIFVKNGTVPVVPLYSYPTINNGTLIQIPIWWTALSVALGLDISGDVIKGVPCIKRYNQLFCPTAGNSYPIEKIEHFIDENKALMRRMYGDFEMNMDNGGPRKQTKKRKRSFIDDPDLFIPPGSFPSTILDDNPAEIHAEEAGETYFGKLRNKRQANKAGNRNAKQSNPSGTRASNSPSTGRLDACESKIEIVTPYWASNSAGKIRAIVNTQHFEQAIHQEICSKAQTPRCQGECGCEQKYKWHRLLAYDPDNDCKGIFMDWFLFPSCCVCRCNP